MSVGGWVSGDANVLECLAAFRNISSSQSVADPTLVISTDVAK